ncbi:MAG: hypothetical protein WC110_05280 [Bacteroidales bacterium]|nr:hypothetical protein [Bacteroidales bacterium]MDD4827517.1 hypothetical protein [Bacteroidales bacterium]
MVEAQIEVQTGDLGLVTEDGFALLGLDQRVPCGKLCRGQGVVEMWAMEKR